jgi:hypothetical protein
MRRELLAHGFQFLEQEGHRADGFIQRALEECISEHQFPFREMAQLIVPGEWTEGLGKIEQVTREDGYVLSPIDRDRLQDIAGRNPSSGKPRYYYSFQQKRIYTYPMSEDELAVVHYSLACWVTGTGARVKETANDDDKPTVPSEFRDVPLLLALSYAKEDVSSHEEAAALRERYNERLVDMQEALVPRQVDEADAIHVTTEMV